jgi:ubiquinone/menaquinone biosynthesis C-methylase UbiE
MPRTPEPEIMSGEEQAYAYSWANFTELHPVMVERFRECYPEFGRGRLLDLGCGTADMTIRFAQAYPELRLLGVDGSASMLAYGTKAVSEAGLERRIALEKHLLPDPELEQSAFDGVISNSLLHHVTDPVALWRETARCARQGAPVMSMDLRRPETEEAAWELVGRYAHRAMPVLKQDFFQSLCAAYTVEEIEEQLQAAGLRSFRVEAIGDCQVLVWGNAPGFPLGAA